MKSDLKHFKHVCMLLFLLCSTVNFSCGTEVENQNYSIRGTVISNSAVVSNALVSIEGNAKFSSQTNNNGEFELKNVPSGSYILKATYNLDGVSYVQSISSLDVLSDTMLQNLILPDPVQVKRVEPVDERSLVVNWSTSNSLDFREYKVYRHPTAGLDENTGTLVYVTTSRNDTFFVDEQLTPAHVYYYRVFVMNAYGIIGGSNIVSGATLPINGVANGSFEKYNELSLSLDSWNQLSPEDSISRDSVNVQEGTYSMRIFYGPFYQHLIQTIDMSGINLSKTYQLTFWALIDTLQPNETVSIGLKTEDTGALDLGYFSLTGPVGKTSWRQYGCEIKFPVDLTGKKPELMIRFHISGSGDEPHKGLLWLDNFALYPK